MPLNTSTNYIVNPYLVALDFDGTAFNTFDDSPAGIGVNKAYELSVQQLFGNVGLERYKELGGHENRTPTELVRLIHSGSYPKLADLSEQLVRIKLNFLLGEIGTHFPDGNIWPQPITGFIDFWNKLYWLRNNSGCCIDTAIISSGHEKFIDKTFATWSLPRPDILVTDDDIRSRKYPKQMERRSKPGQLPIALAHREWLSRRGMLSQSIGYQQFLEQVTDSKSRVIYFGDCAHKDGGLAQTAGVTFGLFDLGSSWEPYPFINMFIFGDWRDVVEKLYKEKEALAKGIPIREIVFPSKSSAPESFTGGKIETRG